VDPEAATLLYYLEGQRASVFSVLDGLPDAALRREVQAVMMANAQRAMQGA
jgi:hypothetical protein